MEEAWYYVLEAWGRSYDMLHKGERSPQARSRSFFTKMASFGGREGLIYELGGRAAMVGIHTKSLAIPRVSFLLNIDGYGEGV